MSFIRISKFRHVFGKPFKRDQCYDAIRISKSSWDSTFCAVNPKYVAVICETSGGGFVVLPLAKVGRIDMNQPLVCGHSGPVLDIDWCPHNDDMVASCGEDCTVKVWTIPEGGVKEPLTEPDVDLSSWHQKRVTTVKWHPSAEHVLLSAGSDCRVILWNLSTGDAGLEVMMPDILFSLSFNHDGSMFACTCKDKKLRVIDSHTGAIKHEIQSHDGTKPQQVAFLQNNKLLTTGFSRMSERQYGLWDVSGSQISSISKEEIDNSNGVLFIFADVDTGMFYLAGKGDSQIRYYEVTDQAPYVHFLSLYQSNSPQRGMGYMPKRGLNVSTNEIARFYKLHNNGLCEVIPFTVPRKSDVFQTDLYPDTASDVPAISADEFFSGKNAPPVTLEVVTLADNAQQSKSAAVSGAVRKSNLLEKRASKITTSQSSNNAEAAAAPSSLPPVKEAKAKASADADVAALVKEIDQLKKTVQEQDSRIKQLEEKMTAMEAANPQTDEEDAGEEVA